MVRFCPIASGSSGNCVYIYAGGSHILIDAGLSGRNIEAGLRALKLTGRQLSAVLVTHEHSDHITGVGVMSRRYGLPVYATPKTWRYFDRHGVLGIINPGLIRRIEPEQPVSIGGLQAVAFDIPHDASQPVGYSIFAENRKITVATDIGEPTDIIRRYIADSNIVLLESNHDADMLLNGKYPKVLKERISGSRGHLSNFEAGKLLAESATDKLRYIFLGHLSEENNRPLIALNTVENILHESGALPRGGLEVFIAERYGLSRSVEI
ncbi:MAG: MBL fold metallo-hydrolase [Clostridiales bacterium]|jgi:phosphoribosyl 1,2-cyclic phosphodiesterase|nr:MBL fold metallo-hydrolase [Clostridiales bacterium]